MNKNDTPTRVLAAILSTTLILQFIQLHIAEANAAGNQGCWASPTVPGIQQSCSCSLQFIGPLPDYHCGSEGTSQRPYKTCKPSGAGYQHCGRGYVQVGSTWDCGIAVNWTVWTACIGAALVCETQCAASSGSNWKKCYAFWSAYLAACTGCSIRTCTSDNTTPLWGLEVIYATGTCPDESTGA